MKLVIADDHSGLKKAVRAVLNGTSYQRCTVHFRRNVLSLLPKMVQGLVAGLLRTVFAQPDRASAECRRSCSQHPGSAVTRASVPCRTTWDHSSFTLRP